MKTCLLCKKTKERSEFALRGMASVCLACLGDEKVRKPATDKAPEKRVAASPSPARSETLSTEDAVFCPRCSLFFKAPQQSGLAKCSRCKLLIDLDTGKILQDIDRRKIYPDPLIIRDRSPAPGEWRISEISDGMVICPDCHVVYPTSLKHHETIVACAKCLCEFKIPAPA